VAVPELSAFDDVMTSLMEKWNIPGAALGVSHNGHLVLARGYGLADVEANQLVQPDSLFRIASISKTFTGVAALKLVEDGKLNLDQNVNEKLKSWKVPDNQFTREEKVTLRRILSHRAGLTIHGFPGYAVGEPVPTVVQVLDGVKPANTEPVRVDVVPGSIDRYSGGGYTVMQLMLGDVTGKPFPELLKELVLDKIGMSHSTYQQPLPPKLLEVAAAGYQTNGEEIKGGRNTYPEMAAAGLWTTASDLARFAIEIQKSREGKANHVLSQSMVNQMLTVQKEPFGLGLSLEGSGAAKRFGHSGADAGFQAMMLATFEGGEGAVVMANSNNGSRIEQEILYGIAAEYGWRDYKPEERDAAHVDAAALATFAGTYQLPPNEVVTIVARGDHLEITLPQLSGIEFYPESADTFFPMVPGFPRIRFEKDASGQVEAVIAPDGAARRVRKIR